MLVICPSVGLMQSSRSLYFGKQFHLVLMSSGFGRNCSSPPSTLSGFLPAPPQPQCPDRWSSSLCLNTSRVRELTASWVCLSYGLNAQKFFLILSQRLASHCSSDPLALLQREAVPAYP